jgi:hypothetical protein
MPDELPPNRPVPRASLIILRVILAAMVALTACFCWFYVRAERWDTPPLIPQLFFSELPLLLALFLLSNKNNQARIACGAGVALGVGALFALSAPLLVFDVGFSIWESGSVYKNLVGLRSLLPALFIGGLGLTIFSWLCARGQRRLLFACLGVFTAYSFLSVAALGRLVKFGTGKQKEDAAWLKPSDEAYRAMMAIGGCLIRHEWSHPEMGFPRSLVGLSQDWGCDAKYAKPQPVMQYILSYTPKIDATSGKATDFQLVVVPFNTRTGPVFPLMIDRRGILFVYAGWSSKGDSAHVAVWPGNVLPVLQKLAEKFKSEHGGRAPASFRDLPGLQNWWPRNIEGDGSTIQMGDAYVEVFYAVREGDVSGFAMSSTCGDYARSCILSYFLDYDGVIHETTQSRPATAQDPVMIPCETDSLQCMDIDWPVPDAPSKLQIVKVSVQQALNSTALW